VLKQKLNNHSNLNHFQPIYVMIPSIFAKFSVNSHLSDEMGSKIKKMKVKKIL